MINSQYKHYVLEQCSVPQENVFGEPMMRQTALALGLVISHIEDKYSDDTIYSIFPSDQIIDNHREFFNAVETAFDAANKLNSLVTIGIEPNNPSSLFGYIQFSKTQDTQNEQRIDDYLFDRGVRKSINFVEKPDEETATMFINSGSFV